MTASRWALFKEMVAVSNSGPNDQVDGAGSTAGSSAALGHPSPASGEVVYMRLLDFVVSQALQSCSRALLVTSRCAGDTITVHAGLTNLQLDELETAFAKLMAAWQLVRKRIGKPQYRHAAARVLRMHELLPAQVSFGRVAQHLLDRASPATGASGKTRSALRLVMDEWSTLSPAQQSARSLPLTTLSRLLQEESTAWRLAFAHRGYSNKALIVDGFGRTYKRARRMSERMVERQQREPLTQVQLQRWRRRILQVASQLELMGDNLSDANKRSLWYLRRLERNLARQAELLLFAEQVQMGNSEHSQMSKKATQRVLKAVAERQEVLQRRGQKLRRRGLQRGATAYCRSIAEDSAQLRGNR